MSYRITNLSFTFSFVVASILTANAQTGPCATIVPNQPLPDLIVDLGRLKTDLVINKENFNVNSCAVVESCVPSRGIHQLLRFTASTPNIGPGDLVIGDPNQCSNLFHLSECHNHYHFEQYSDYRLWTEEGYSKWTNGRQLGAPSNSGINADLLAKAVANHELLTGRKQGFCMIDSANFSADPSSTKKYTLCGAPGVPGNQGLQAGWTDIYSQNLDCQYVPIDGLAAGVYVLEVEVNPEHLLPESRYDNNSGAVRFRMSLSKGNQSPQIQIMN